MGRIVGENKHKGDLYPVDSKAIYRIIYEVVAVLPTENIKTSVIYCVPIIGKDNEYDMYLYINGWSKIGSGSIDLSDYMTLAPLNPTAQEIAAMPSGQIYDDVTKKIVTIKGGTELSGVIRSSNDPEYAVPRGSLGQLLRYGQLFYICDGNYWKPVQVADSNVIKARLYVMDYDGDYTIASSVTLQEVRELFTKFHCVKISITNQYGQDVGMTCLILRVTGNNHEHLSAILLPTSTDWSNGSAYNRVHFLEQHAEESSDTLQLVTKYVYPPREQYYTKTEINQKGYLTLDTLPIYDGTVI